MSTVQTINLKVIDTTAGGGAIDTPLVPNTGSEALTTLTNFLADSYTWLVPVALALVILTILAILVTRNIIKGKSLKTPTAPIKVAVVALITLPLLSLVSLYPNQAKLVGPTLSVAPNQIDLTIDKNGGNSQTATQTTITVADFTAYQYNITASLAAPNSRDITLTLDNQTLSQNTPVAIISQQNQNTTYTKPLEVTITNALATGDYEISLDYGLVEVPEPVVPTMQAFTNADCAALPIYDGADQAAVTKLNDPRGNGQQYQVARLADGRCWMLNNLKLGLFDQDLNLTTADTNVVADWPLPAIDNGLGMAYDQPRAYALVSGQTEFDSNLPNSAEADLSSPNFAGYYYNWCAATAGTASVTTCTPSSTGPDAPTGDICPANWRLPNGGDRFDSTNEFAQLTAALAGESFSDYASNFNYGPKYADGFQFSGPFKGVISGLRIDVWDLQGVYGYWWSSSSNDSHAFSPGIGASFVGPDAQWPRGFGLSVRCLLK
jgi:uncharacterized protein (TIGR02145 family)